MIGAAFLHCDRILGFFLSVDTPEIHKEKRDDRDDAEADEVKRCLVASLSV